MKNRAPGASEAPVATYYNEIEPFAADWLEELARRGAITEGRVDRRSIADVRADDVRDARRAHFFAGIGCWDYALGLAGWPADSEHVVWTGSCPCQPFSQAGGRAGFADERHLWPEWFRLIAECRPAVVFGEQVASPDGLAWLDVVQADLEGAGYAVGAADLCAAGVGAPHRRQRLWFVAIRGDLADAECVGSGAGRIDRSHGRAPLEPDRHGAAGLVADDDEDGRGVERAPRVHADGAPGHNAARRSAHGAAVGHTAGDGLEGFVEPGAASRAALRAGGAVGDAGRDRDQQHARELPGDEGEHALGSADRDHAPVAAGAARDPWADVEWVWCTDGRWRPTEPGTFPLAHGTAGRVGLLRAYGNAIVPQVAEAFIRAACASAALPLVDTGHTVR